MKIEPAKRPRHFSPNCALDNLKMETFQRSHSLDLDLAKSAKFEFAPDRNRNDSGCFDDFDVERSGSSGSVSPQDPVVTYWDEAINQWSERARSVIAQEVLRMNELTKKSKRELQKTDDREKVHKAWKQHMRETMDLALDLMKCVSYDILEEFGFEPAPCEDYRKSEKHLTRIAEEESADDGLMKSGKGHSKRVVIIRVDHRIRRVPLKRRCVVRSPFAKSVPKAGKSKLGKNTMTMMLEELKELRKMVGMKKSADTAKEVWGCKQCLSSPTSWKELTGPNVEEVEDIFNDWVRMLKKKDIHINADINDVFWNISFDKDKVRMRRMSEVIEDMPFEDRPDIFQDRCEILESDARIVKKKPPVKSYWNIFSDWKFNLKEPAQPMSDWEILERKKNAQNLGKMEKRVVLDQEDYLMDWRLNFVPRKKPVKRMRPLESEDHLMIWRQIFNEQRKSRGRKRKDKKPKEQEDFFEDWRQNFTPKSKRQIKRDLLKFPQEDYFFVWRQIFLDPTLKVPKKSRIMRQNLEQEDFFMDWRKNLDPTGIRDLPGNRDPSPEEIFADWHPILDRDPRHRRRSVEEMEEDEVIFITSPFKKIKHDFQGKKRAESMAYKFGRVYQGMRRNFLISVGSSKLKDNFEFWSSDSTVQSLIESRMEFCRLRFEMRKQRQVNREMNAVIDPESWFDDWRWNLDDEKVCTARVERRASDPVVQLSPEKIFSDWRRISLDYQSAAASDTFNEWMRNLKGRVVTTRKMKVCSAASSQSTEMREKLSSPSKPPTASTSKFVIAIPIVFPAKNQKDSKSLKHPQTGKNPSDKHSMRLMAKCHAKQPFGRGRN